MAVSLDNGAAVYRDISALNTGQVVKNAPGLIVGWVLTNLGAATRYVKLYDKATAAAGTDTPLLTLAVPTLQTLIAMPGEAGVTFGTGISVRAVTGVADADNTAPGANEVIMNLFYR